MGTGLCMAREIRVRLSEEEAAKVDRATEEMFGENAADEVSRGATIAQLADEFLGDSNE